VPTLRRRSATPSRRRAMADCAEVTARPGPDIVTTSHSAAAAAACSFAANRAHGIRRTADPSTGDRDQTSHSAGFSMLDAVTRHPPHSLTNWIPECLQPLDGMVMASMSFTGRR
jgi:hypothetical protein